MFACFVALAWLAAPAPAVAQDHPCESDSVRARGGENLYRRECCQQRPYRALEQVARAEGIEIRKRTTAQEPVAGYFYCVVDFAWQDSREAWRQNDANFEACLASVKKVEAERKRSAPGSPLHPAGPQVRSESRQVSVRAGQLLGVQMTPGPETTRVRRLT